MKAYNYEEYGNCYILNEDREDVGIVQEQSKFENRDSYFGILYSPGYYEADHYKYASLSFFALRYFKETYYKNGKFKHLLLEK